MLTPRRMSTAPSAVSPLGAIIPRPGSAASQAARPSSAAGHNGHQTRPTNPSDGTDGETQDARNVRVVVRIRPSLADETVPLRLRNVLIHPTSAADLRIDIDPAQLAGNAGLTTGAKRHPTFTFDHVLGEESDQVDLYDVTAKDVVEEYLKGHNVTFLASGKSYSMGTTGEDMDYSGTAFTPRTGLIPRTVRAIFDRAEEIRLASGSGSSWECRLSFLELYNEEIIDLLSGAGVQISIREERDGRIIWSGVREVKVKTLAEVMQLLQDGAARRQTGETGMNATSSRSHAIFSLTMVQKKRAGMSVSISQPISPPGTPKTLKRPASSIGLPRAGTPSGARSGPPIAFAQKQSGIPRPTSMMGHRDDDFVIVTSKFNMVDLAGSERLKRTAAQGERRKEGISINSGLSALGNVISALSDPRSAKGHIPYRDSKLTRMLQDSIGGNALTTMIACVSPIEYNVAETLNTIKYASRARNIKNNSKVNAVEAGWDDVEHLQTTILKLRKQIAALDVDGVNAGPAGMSRALPADAQRQSEKLIQRLAELQREHTELYDRYLAKCNENMRLTSELKSATPGDADVLARFNETVEPVILEYEKVVSALNIQLDDLRAQLSLLDTLYEEQGRGLVEAQERQTQSESYAAELRARVGKLHDQNSANESYISDLEAKLKTHTDASDGHSDAAMELRKEMAKLKATNDSLSHHSAEIEARLSQSEEKSATLVQQIERLEADISQRETAYKELESHIALLDTSQDNKLLVAELEERGRQIASLETERSTAQDAEKAERERLEKLLDVERSTQDDLRRQLARQAMPTPPPSRLIDSVSTTREASAASTDASDAVTQRQSGREDDSNEVAKLREMIEEITKKAADAEDRCTAAQTRVEELQTQLVEVREANDTLPFTPSISLSNLDDISESGSTVQTPRETSPGHSPPLSRSKRGSLPILSATGFSTKAPGFRGGRGYGESRQNRPQSLSQELSSAQQSLISPRGSWAGSNSLLFGPSPSKQSLPTIKPLRTSTSSDLRLQKATETELKFVHKVVKERDEELRQKDAYIRQLESSLSLQQKQHVILSRQPSAQSLHPNPHTIPLPPSPDTQDVALPSDTSDDTINQPETPSTDEVGGHTLLVPSTSEPEFFTPAGEISDPLAFERTIRPTESMLEMQKKEASQRQIIEQQFKQIADLQKANLRLRDELAGGYPELYRNVEVVRQKQAISDASHSPVTPKKSPSSPFAQLSPSAELNQLRDEHAEELQAIITGHTQTIETLQRDCEARISAMEAQIESMTESYQQQILQLQSHHTSQLSSQQQTHDEAVAKIRKDAETMNAELNASLASHDEARRQLKMKADQALFELSRIRDESQIQRNTDAKQIAELLRSKAALEEAIDELEVSKVDWMKRNGELEQRYSRKVVGQSPPQGPPPNMPLPPIPSALGGAGPAVPHLRSIERASSNSGSSRDHGRASDELSRVQDIDAAVPLLPAHIGEMVQAIKAERDRVAAEVKQLEERLAASEQAEQELSAQLEKTQTLSRDLADARKTSSKLRAHLEDSRNEVRRQQDECKAHMDDLVERRQQVTKVDEHKRSADRDSLLSANAQVAALKAQLEKAVDAKVNKKMGSKLKCF